MSVKLHFHVKVKKITYSTTLCIPYANPHNNY